MNLSDSQRLVEALRILVREAAPEAIESEVWDGLSYHLPELGGRVKGAVCQIAMKGEEVELGFIHGVLLSDPQGLLRGEGKSKRHVRLASLSHLPDQALVDLIRAAVVTRPGGSDRKT